MPAATTEPPMPHLPGWAARLIPTSHREGWVDVDQAAAMCDLTTNQLRGLLARRAKLIAGSPAGRFTANPRPLSGVSDGPVWDRGVFRLWALQMGLTTYEVDGEDRYLIGYAGMATMFGWREQSVRLRATRDPLFPPRIQPPDEVVVRDRSEVLAYAIQHAILFPDGRPNLGRPHRGNPIPKT